MTAELSREEIARYSRHLIMPEVTIDGQRKLKQGSVLLVGAGGLGSPAALYLAAAGIGRIGILDFDVVDESNLQRQILHDTSWIGKPKLDSAKARLNGLNPHVAVETHRRARLVERARDHGRLRRDRRRHRQLRDALPHERRLLPAQEAERLRLDLPLRGAGERLLARSRAVLPLPLPGAAAAGAGPELRRGRRARDPAGRRRRHPGDRGAQDPARESASRWWAGCCCTTRSRCSFEELKLRRDPNCPLCGENPTIKELQDYAAFCGIGRGEEAEAVEEIAAAELKRRLDAGDPLEVIDVREPHEFAIAKIPGTRLIPLGSLSEHLHELDTARTYVVHCKSGARSAKAIGQLRRVGFKRLLNLKGGILAWSKEVDPSVPTY